MLFLSCVPFIRYDILWTTSTMTVSNGRRLDGFARLPLQTKTNTNNWKKAPNNNTRLHRKPMLIQSFYCKYFPFALIPLFCGTALERKIKVCGKQIWVNCHFFRSPSHKPCWILSVNKNVPHHCRKWTRLECPAQSQWTVLSGIAKAVIKLNEMNVCAHRLSLTNDNDAHILPISPWFLVLSVSLSSFVLSNQTDVTNVAFEKGESRIHSAYVLK